MRNLVDRRAVLGLLAGGAAASGPARAQSWLANRTIRLVCPYPAGGGGDAVSRLLAQKFGEYWPANVIVENKPGAGGNIGAEQVARAAPDGTQMLVFSVGMATNKFLYPKINYDPVADFVPVSLFNLVPNILVAGKHTPYSSTRELIDYAKAHPGRVNFGSSGLGTSPHLSGELFSRMAGIKLTHVPYRGTAPLLTDMMGGRVDIGFDNGSYQQFKAGQLKGFGVTTAHRVQSIPELGPIAEILPGYDVSSWYGLFLPAGTPREIVEQTEAAARRAAADPAVKERVAAQGGETVGSTSAELKAFLQKEMDKWGGLIREAGLKME